MAYNLGYMQKGEGDMSRPVLKVEIGSLGFGGGQEVGIEEYRDLQQQLKKWFKEQDVVYVAGARVGAIQISVCEQLDDLHCIPKEEVMVRK